jgi:hypothetical protein
MEAYLGRPVDAGYEGYESSPVAIVAAIAVLLLSGVVMVLGVLVASPPLIWGGAVPATLSGVALPWARRHIPVRWVAVSGEQVTVLSTVRDTTNTPVATGVLFDGSLDDVAAHQSSSAAVTIGTEPVWFLRSRQRAVAELRRTAG